MIDLYITGYGHISGAKLYFVPPSNFVDTGSSRVEFDLASTGGPIHKWGATNIPLSAGGITIDLSSGGLQLPKWPHKSLFFDAGQSGNIATEMGNPNPPVRVVLKTQKKIASGDHNLSFVLTYFNGREWSISYRTASLHVPTMYERYEGWAWFIGALLAFFALAATIVSAIAPFISSNSFPSPTPLVTVSSAAPGSHAPTGTPAKTLKPSATAPVSR